MVTNGDIGGGGYIQMVTSPQYFFNINIFHISYHFHHIITSHGPCLIPDVEKYLEQPFEINYEYLFFISVIFE